MRNVRARSYCSLGIDAITSAIPVTKNTEIENTSRLSLSWCAELVATVKKKLSPIIDRNRNLDRMETIGRKASIVVMYASPNEITHEMPIAWRLAKKLMTNEPGRP